MATSSLYICRVCPSVAKSPQECICDDPYRNLNLNLEKFPGLDVVAYFPPPGPRGGNTIKGFGNGKGRKTKRRKIKKI